MKNNKTTTERLKDTKIYTIETFKDVLMVLLDTNIRCYTANVYSSITDKLMHLFVASTLKCLFWDFLELCDNYRQISVELPNNKNTQRKNWENFEIMKKIVKITDKYLLSQQKVIIFN